MKRRNGDCGSDMKSIRHLAFGPVSLSATAAWAAGLVLLGACGSSDQEGSADRANTNSMACVNELVSGTDGTSLGPNEFTPQCVVAQECEPGKTKPCSDGWFEEALGVCEFGTRTCDEDGYWGVCDGVVVPTDEVCDDGLDNDCDNKIDCVDPDCHDDPICCGSECEPECELGETVSCNDGLFDEAVGVCKEGKRVCDADGEWGSCEGVVGPSPEACQDRLDNDCDGDTDCDDEDCADDATCAPECKPGETLACNDGLFTSPVGQCKEGKRVCDASGEWGPCQGAVGPSPEACDDQVDNDCDGKTDCEDEDCGDFPKCGWTCQPGTKEACKGNSTGVCSPGQRTCTADGTWGACTGVVKPSQEVCNDRRDNDCDGKVDCADSSCSSSSICMPKCTKITKMETADRYLRDCNAHKGDNLNACRAVGNTAGCASEVFNAWCTRRINDTWKRMHRDWVANRCSGTVKLTSVKIGGISYPRYQCDDWKKCVHFRATTPLVLVFDVNEPVQYHVDDGEKSFDLSSAQDGSATRTDWPTAATPWLALDRDGDGQINSGRELFGSATMLGGSVASHGFEALAPLDVDGNGKVDAKDPGFDKLVLWYDHNGDRESQQGELRSMKDVGIVSLQVRYQRDARCDARGNCGIERAVFHWRDKQGKLRKGAIVDVHLAIRR